MAGSSDVVSILVKLEELRQFLSGTEKASKGVAGMGTAAETSGKKAKIGWKGIAQWAGGAAILYKGTQYVESAVSGTMDLAHATINLHRITGMDVSTASQWSAMAQERHITTKQLGLAMVTLSRQESKQHQLNLQSASSMAQLNDQYRQAQVEGGTKGAAALQTLQGKMTSLMAAGQKARSMWTQLGVSQQAINRGDTSEVLKEVADGLKGIKNPADRAAYAQKLFGKAAQNMLPIMLHGRKGIDEALATVRKYGDYLGVHSVKQLHKLIENQRELNYAQAGMKVQLGTALMPLLLALTNVIVKIARALAPWIKHTGLLVGVITALTAAFVGYRTMMIASAIAQAAFNTELGVTAALLTFGIPLLIIGLVALFVVLYKKVGWFRAGVQWLWKVAKAAFAGILHAAQFVYGWVKTNWPYLLGIMTGPFGLAAVFVIKHWKAVKAFVFGIISDITQAFKRLLGFVKSLPSKLGGWIKKVPGLGKVMGIAGKVGGVLGHIPGLQQGGRVSHSGAVLIGEQGPEVMHLPRGAMVQPLAAPVASIAGPGAPLGGQAEIVVPLYLDSKIVARAVARVTADKLARR
jgi:hypothetical protein